mmetsp:Transcript_19858/g.23592  ORF Transcript_19858/g.23592 Transcript_19858/m.23592 type:complete len:183 (-) Transcript_19858:81-629(-)
MENPIHVQATPVKAVVVQAQVVGQTVNVVDATDSLVAFPGANEWHDGECDRCCNCSGDCGLAWFLPCFSLAHISSKLDALDAPYCLKFWHIATLGILFWIIDMIFYSLNIQLQTLNIFIFIVVFQLRGIVRQRLAIPGDCCMDCLWSFFCVPCAITQMNGTLWRQPENEPGCSCDDRYAQIV